jgi:hypothetical protein
MSHHSEGDRPQRRGRSTDSLDKPGGYNNRSSSNRKNKPGGKNNPRSTGRGGSLENNVSGSYRGAFYGEQQTKWDQPGPYRGVTPSGYRRSDESVNDDICIRLTQHAQIDAREIEVEVKDGIVTLTGTVEDKSMKRMVEVNVEMISGVIDIKNELKVRVKKSEEEERKEAEFYANPFPGGPVPTGSAGYDDNRKKNKRR